MQSVSFDPELLKAHTREQWDRAAEGWYEKRDLIRAWLREPTRAMLDLAAIGPGACVLDVAAGAGDQTLDIADRVGPSGHVLATDISQSILQFARENALQAGFTNVDVQVADGERLDVAPIFDAAVCRLGLMFYPDPLGGLREMRRALKPEGRACTLVFSEPAANPCITILVATALKHVRGQLSDPFRPGGLLSLGRPGHIEALFEQAGFTSVCTVRMTAPMRLPSSSQYLDFIRTSAGPILQLLEPLGEAAKEAAWSDMTAQLDQFNRTSEWVGPNELLLTVGIR